MKIALVGNPNSGKTTLFNNLTKSNQKIGNWPGVTTEKKEGVYFKDKSIEIIDLPGIYSLSPISKDEKAACDYLENSRPDVVINVIDSTNLERSLFLTLKLIETDIPIVLALNMEDELKLNGLTLDIAAIEKELKVCAVLISALKNKNIQKLIDSAILASKIIKRDGIFLNSGKTEEEKAQFRHMYISTKINSFRVKTVSKASKITQKIDKFVLNRFLAFPIFALVIFLMYFVSVQTLGRYSVDFTSFLFQKILGENLRKWLNGINSKVFLTSLIVDGILGGVSAVFAFIPQILILFLFITFLETCGYMARVAVIMDRLFKGLGLSGKSFIPMIIGCGCSVPAIMSAKAIDGDAEKKATIMLTPFIPCSAKLPLFALFAGALFPNNPFIAPSMYFLGIFMVVIGALILKAFRKKETDGIFLIELPHYRLPSIKNLFVELIHKAKEFVIRAGKIIIPAAMTLWFLKTFTFSLQLSDIENSMLADIGKAVCWIFKPLGFSNWQSAIAIISGIFAKETIVATFGVVFKSGGAELHTALTGIFTEHSAYAFMAFTLLSAPCIAAISATRKEIGGIKWTLIAIGFQCFFGYITALIINQLGNLYELNSLIFYIVIVSFFVFLFTYFSIRLYVKRKKRKEFTKIY